MAKIVADATAVPAVDLQRRAYRVLNEDGIVDFALGLGLLFAGSYVGLNHAGGVNMTAWAGLAPVFVMLIARGLRKRFVYPRIGYARSRPASPAIVLTATMLLLLVAGLVVMTVYARRGVRPPATLMPWLLRAFALAGAATLALMGRQTGFARFYVHAGVIVAAVFASLAVHDVHRGLLLMLGLPGLVLLVTGLVCFFIFLRRHPKTTTEATHANS
ncbi:hypothetical protein FJY68_04580 [candidate division WOR-3 bacterium]|uniref:Uncharacterized protein n=1 Tax=candidate division WOR-3 bacterium TaxID=2052148 RepID=A0A937XEZ2_UNCW3|nr:hypothetical protein [candidate division WOR-3 bacterium]